MRFWPLLVFFIVACGSKDNTLCDRFYAPYPDFISQRQRTAANAALLDAMAAYSKGDFTKAAIGLHREVDKNDRDYTARMYLASALIGAGDPYKAEMHLDFLEKAPSSGFKDQVEWYNALCWLCSGQYARSLQQSMWIAEQPAHTYKAEAHALALTLSDH